MLGEPGALQSPGQKLGQGSMADPPVEGVADQIVALAALEASVIVQGASGERRIAFEDFYRLPGTTPQLDMTLKPGELITAIYNSSSPATPTTANFKASAVSG